MKTLLFFLIWLPLQAVAFEQWYVAVHKNLKTVLVYNRQSQTQVLWISGAIKGLPSSPEEKLEQSFEIPAYGLLEIPLIDFKQHPWLRFKTQDSKKLQITLTTAYDQEVLISPGSSNRLSARAPAQAELILSNLAPFDQKIRILDLAEKEIRQFQVPGFSNFSFQVPPELAGKSLLLDGEARIQGFFLSAQKSQAVKVSSRSSSLQLDLNKTYFRLSNSDQSQSYLVGFDDANMIRQAREQISQTTGFDPTWLPRILIAEVSYGSGLENRDPLQLGKPLWSWHISKAIRFSQLAHQDCDGSPEMLEELLKPWVNKGGVICFWNYKIVEEISPPVPLWKQPVPASLQP